MNISALCIARPVATLLLAFGIVVLGATAFLGLPIASLPAVERPTIAVNSQLPGASADTIASGLAQPLEHELGTIPGIIQMASYSTNGGTQILIQFELEKDIDVAAAEVQAAINAAGPNLPKDLPWPPYYRKANPSGLPPIALALTSDVLPASEVYDYADSVLSPKLAKLPGVADVVARGADRSAVRVQVVPRQLANMKISLEQVRNALRTASQNLPKGTVAIDGRSFSLSANDQLIKAAEYRDIVVAARNGAVIRLRDVAQVSDATFNSRTAGWVNDQHAVIVFVLKQPDANVVEVVDQVKAQVPQLSNWLPPSIKVSVLFDRTTLIRASIADVQLTVLTAIVLIVVVLAFFLRNLPTTSIPVFTIPVVLAATAIVMNVAGYSLDNLSLMAVTIAVGFIVDDAVIVVENVMRRSESGEEPFAASVRGMRQIRFTIISMTCALIGALLPILFMPDVVGRYFREFGMTLAAAIIASAGVSLTLTPMLCSRLARRRAPIGIDPPAPSRRSLPLRAYLRTLDWFLARPTLAVVALFLAFALSAGLYVLRPKGFMPTQDIGLFTLRTVAIPNVSFAEMERLQRAVTDVVLKDPAVAGISSYIGGDYGSTLSNGTMWVSLKPLDERKESIQQVIARLRSELAGMSSIRSFFTPWQDLQLGVQNSVARYEYTLTAIDPDELLLWSDRMRERMRRMPELTDVIWSAEQVGLEAGLVIDRQRAAAFGVTPFAIDQTLYDGFGQRMVRPIFLPSNWSQVILEVLPQLQSDPSAFDDLYVQGPGTAQVPLSMVMRPRRGHAPMWLRHNEQFPSITIYFDTKPGVSIGQAIAAIGAAAADMRLPDDIRAEFRGEAREATKSGSTQALLYLGAVFAIYVVLGMLYESYVHPLTILTTLPSTLFGALAALTATGTEFTLITAIGCIMVVGLTMKNAIIMVDFALAAQRTGMSSSAAIIEAARLRVRPIMMTSLVAIAGAVPLATATGPGHELRQPLGLAILGGLLAAQMLALYTTPAVFVLMSRFAGGTMRSISFIARESNHPAASGKAAAQS